MMLKEHIQENNLKVGMHFENTAEVMQFLGYENLKTTRNKVCISHYCDFDINSDFSISITKIYDPIKPFRRDWKYNIGQIIQTSKGQYKIIDRYMNNYIEDGKQRTRQWYDCQCLICGEKFDYSVECINNLQNCPKCGNFVLLSGINSIADEHPELISYFVNPEDTYKYKSHTNKRLNLKCPICGVHKSVLGYNLVNSGFRCDYCSDGISYPNKFIREFLKQLNISFESEKHFSWASQKSYDQYIAEKSMIIENHGLQHYKDPSKLGIWRKDENNRDIEKQELAFQNGIQHYIILDCSKSTMNFIKTSIMKSELPTLLHFNETDIDWAKCEQQATTSLIKQVWDQWNKEYNYSKLIDDFNLNASTLREYIQKGINIGYCIVPFYSKNAVDYKDNKDKQIQNYMKPIYCITDNIYFNSATEAEKYYNKQYIHSSIGRAARNHKLYRGKQFQFITRKQFNELKQQSLQDTSIKVYGDFFDEKYLEEVI